MQVEAFMGEPGTIGPAASHILETEIDGDISLYNPHTEQVTVLNGTAGDVWRVCDGEHSLIEIVDLLAGAYGVEPVSIHDDVVAAITSFEHAELFSDTVKP